MKTQPPLMPQSYTSVQLADMAKTWDSSTFGMAIDARMRQIEKHDKQSFIERGLCMYWVERLELFRTMYGGDRFKTMGQWIVDACPYSRSTAYAALGEVKRAMADGLSLDDASKMPRCNLKTVNRLSTKLKNDPEILKAAETMEERAFLRKIEKEHPDQHVEDKAPMRFNPDKSQRKTVDACIDAVMLLDSDIKTREDAVESVCAFWMEAHQEELEALVAKA